MRGWWELQRIGILRTSDCFQVVSPAGGLCEMDKRSLKLLLKMHGKPVNLDIKNYTCQEVKEFALFAEEEMLLKKRPATKEVEPPFNISQVIKNLDSDDIKMLTLGDLVLQITNDCNYQCRGCSSNAHFGGILKSSDVDFERIIKDAARFGCLTLGLTGGEPILPNIITKVLYLVETAKEHNFQKVIIATNGFYVKRFVRRLKRAGVTRLSISFHGFDGYMESYTGCSRASIKSQEAIEACLNEGLHLGINCVLTRQNLSQMDQIIETFYPIIEKVPHSYLRFSPLLEVGRANGCQDYLLNGSNMATILRKVNEYQQVYGEKIRLTCDEEYDSDNPMVCDAGLMYAIVSKTGNISACDILESYWSAGEMRKESFFDVWNDNERWHEFRQIIPINDYCASCPTGISKICFGRCKAISYLKFGSLLMDKPPNERRCLRCGIESKIP